MKIRKNTLVRQQEILHAARMLIVKHGSENVTVRKMAQEIGVSEAAIYRHFKSKREILSFLIDDLESTFTGDIEKSCSEKRLPLQILESIVNEHVLNIKQSKGVDLQVISEVISLGDKKLNKKVHTVISKYVERIKSILADGIKEGSIRPDIDTDAAAQTFFSLIQGSVNVWVLGQYNSEFDLLYKSSWNVFRNAIILPPSL